jgi:hypothetical protein
MVNTHPYKLGPPNIILPIDIFFWCQLCICFHSTVSPPRLSLLLPPSFLVIPTTPVSSLTPTSQDPGSDNLHTCVVVILPSLNETPIVGLFLIAPKRLQDLVVDVTMPPSTHSCL